METYPLKVGGGKRRGISSHAHNQSLVSGVAEHRQASKAQRKISGVDGSLTFCGDAQKESENNAFIQVFHPMQSVKSTNEVMLRYTHIRQDEAQRWRR